MNWLKSALFVGAVLVGGLSSTAVHAEVTSTEPIVYDGIRIGETYTRSVPFLSQGKEVSEEYFVEVTGEGAEYLSLSGDRFTMSADKEMVIIDYTIDASNAKKTKKNQVIKAAIEIYKLVPEQLDEEELKKLEEEAILKDDIEKGKDSSDKQVREVVSKILFEFSFVDEDDDREVFTIIKPSSGNSYQEEANVFNHLEKSEVLSAYFAILNQGNVVSSIDNVKLYVVAGELEERQYKKIEKNEELLIEKEFSKKNIQQAEAFSSKVSTVSTNHQLSEGVYSGVLVFEDDEKEIARLGNSFYVFPDNSGGMYIEVSDVQLSDDNISVQDPLSVSVELKNSGIIDVDPIVYIELYKGDVLIEKKEVKREVISVGEKQDYLAAFSQQPKGEYILRAYATYGSIKTPEVEQSVFVTAPVGEIDGSVILVVVILLIFIVIITALAGTSKKKSKKRKKKPYRFV